MRPDACVRVAARALSTRASAGAPSTSSPRAGPVTIALRAFVAGCTLCACDAALDDYVLLRRREIARARALDDRRRRAASRGARRRLRRRRRVVEIDGVARRTKRRRAGGLDDRGRESGVRRHADDAEPTRGARIGIGMDAVRAAEFGARRARDVDVDGVRGGLFAPDDARRREKRARQFNARRRRRRRRRVGRESRKEIVAALYCPRRSRSRIVHRAIVHRAFALAQSRALSK